MSVQTEAKAQAGRVANSRTLDITARIGFLGYGLVHVLVAWIALQIAFGGSSEEGDQYGAFAMLARDPVGMVALVLTVVGLAAMAVWQGIMAAIGHRDSEGGKRVWKRLGSAARAVIYAVLAFTAGRVVAGNGESSAQNKEDTTAGLLGNGFGRTLIVLVGLVVIALGVGLVIHGLRRKFEKNLRSGEMNPQTRKAARWLGTVGYTGKGVAYTVVGVLVGWAALSFDPEKSRGLDAALRALAAETYGWFVLLLVALGFAAFGGYCVIQARYRKV